MKKLEYCSIRGIALPFFIFYKYNTGTQVIRIDEGISYTIKVNCGVPQGTVLCPLLFLIYINGLINFKN